MTQLRIPPDIAKRLVWSRPDGCIPPFCSLCGGYIPDDCVPLIMWSKEGACVHFCDFCVAQYIHTTR